MTRWLVATLLAITLMACAHNEDKDFAAMNTIPLRTVCVGRMLVDVPKGNLLHWQQHFDYAEVSRLPYPVRNNMSFWTMVQDKKHMLEAQKHYTEPSLLSGYLKIGDNAAMLLHRESESDIYGYDLDRYLWLGHWGYWFESKALLANDQKNLFSTFDTIFRQLVPINNFEPTTKPGFCIDSALVTGQIGPIWSAASTKVAPWEHVTIDVGASEDDGSRALLPWEKIGRRLPIPTPFDDLHMREDVANESMKTDDVARIVSMTVLRKRETKLAGMLGQETVFKLKLANGQEYYRFDWGSIDEANSPNKTGMNLDLEAGSGQYTPYYEPPPPQDELFALWDAMLQSLRPRPGAR